MRAIVITETGGPDVLRWAEVPDPMPPGPGEVRLSITATAINRADLLQRIGEYDPPPGAPAYPGLECSGIIEDAGADVGNWRIGDPALALVSGGGYAEQVVVPAGQLFPVPDGIGLVAGAALPEVACTVWSTVFMRAGLCPGETLLVHGGGSGCGTMAIQLGRAAGARVIVTAGSAEKVNRCVGLGAEAGINYREEDFVARVRELTDGRGADVILDIMGASYLDRNLDALAKDGRLSVIGLQGGQRAELDLGRLVAKRAAVLATSLRARPLEQKAGIVSSVIMNVWPHIASGAVRPVIDRILPVADAAEGHRIVEATKHFGKVVLVVRDQPRPTG